MMGERELEYTWTVWIHFPYDTNWNIESYTKLCDISTIERLVYVMKSMESITKNCMVFIMKKGVLPLWEHEQNKGGGAFSYKIPEQNMMAFWNALVFRMIGCTLLKNSSDMSYVNGVTISPKKSFHIIKLWFKEYKGKESSIENISINDDVNITHEGKIYTAFT